MPTPLLIWYPKTKKKPSDLVIIAPHGLRLVHIFVHTQALTDMGIIT